MKIRRLELRNFTAIEEADFDFARGLNVLIGENGTGKSHVMKLLYSVLRAAQGKPATAAEAQQKLGEKLAAVFKPEDGKLEHLVRNKAEPGSEIWIQGEAGEALFTLSEHGDIRVTRHTWPELPDSLFLPTRDVLAMYEGFIPAYEKEALSFDETYYDVCVALERGKARGEALAFAERLLSRLQEAFGGKRISKERGRFYVESAGLKLEAHLVAEGLRKLALLSHLISNASIKEGGVLFWDEPESNLNPRLIARLPDILMALVEAGIQVFVATHDYLLAHKLSLLFEYGVAPRKVDARFFALYRPTPAAPALLEQGATLAQLKQNVILEEYAALQDWEEELLLKETRGGDEGGRG